MCEIDFPVTSVLVPRSVPWFVSPVTGDNIFHIIETQDIRVIMSTVIVTAGDGWSCQQQAAGFSAPNVFIFHQRVAQDDGGRVKDAGLDPKFTRPHLLTHQFNCFNCSRDFIPPHQTVSWRQSGHLVSASTGGNSGAALPLVTDLLHFNHNMLIWVQILETSGTFLLNTDDRCSPLAVSHSLSTEHKHIRQDMFRAWSEVDHEKKNTWDQ